MTDTPPSSAPSTTALTRAMDTIKKLRAQLDEQSGRVPVAIVGAGLRLPGGISTLEGFWHALAQGRDLVAPMPAHRKGPFAAEWDALPHRGGFLDDVLGFDAAYFGISPREARALDPQHRLLLEVAHEALENAAIPPATLGGDTKTGLYVGVTGQDYRDWQVGEPDAYWATGNGHCFAAGRISYTLGLTGPAVAVDTACSSSLVGVHLAVQALRRGECDVALAGGVNLVLSPRSTRLVVQTRSLSPDGLCRAFDARANGFVRGEGAGVIVLKRLDRALADGDRVLAVVAGSALNQDGRSSGFTAPNVLSQTALIKDALADAGLEPADVGLVEAHGTGTSLGDPIEMEALAAALGAGTDHPLWVGSAKTNVGHLEAAAGITGLLKAVLSLRHGAVAPLVHFRTLNPRIELDGTRIALPSAVEEWAAPGTDGGPGRHAGVSSFGMSGTNAHVILAPAPAEGLIEAAPASGFTLSARTPQALAELAGAVAAHAETVPPGDYPALAYTLTSGRTRHPIAAHVRAATPMLAARALRALAAGEHSDAVTVVDAGAATPAPATSELPRRVADAPTYPFQRQEFAPLELPASTPVAPSATTASATTSTTTTVPEAGEVADVAGPVERYELGWEFLDLPTAPRPSVPLVIAGDDADTVALLVRAALSRGHATTLLTPAPVPGLDADGVTEGRLPTSAEGWTAFWQGRAEGTRLLLAPAATALPASIEEAEGHDPATSAARLAHAVTTAALAVPAGSSLTLLTRGVVTVTGAEGDVTAGTDAGVLHGLAPVLGLEAGAAFDGVVDLPLDAADADADAVLALVTAPRVADAAVEDLVAVRAGVAVGRRLRPATRDAALTVRGEGTHLVTGALGGVGRAIVRDLAGRGARHLLLLGRTAEDDLPEAGAALLAELRGAGVDVAYVAADAADPAALRAALARCGADLPPLAGVVHAAGTIAKVPLAQASEESFAAALRGKWTGAWWLHLLTAGLDLDHLVQVSSVSGVWGTDGYGAYAAANGGLDAIAAHRTGRGLAASSVAFGPWALDGMADPASRAALARMGVSAIDAEAGCATLTAHPGGAATEIACTVAWDRFCEVMGSRRRRALFAELAPAPSPAAAVSPQTAAAAVQPTGAPAGATGEEAGDPATEAAPAGPLAAVLALPQRARAGAVTAHVRALVAQVLGHAAPEDVREDLGFFDLGVDSIMTVDLARDLGETFGVALRVGDVFDHPTVADLGAHLASRLPDAAPHEAPAAPATAPAAGRRTAPTTVVTREVTREITPDDVAAALREPIAIVGMAGRFPGADSVEELWDLLLTGRDGVRRVPADRWDADALTDTDPVRTGTISTDQGGFLSDLARFDAAFFDIPAREAESLDPQQRLLLESTWHALEDARIDPRSLKGTRTGVYVGITNSDYARLLESGGLGELDAYFGTGTSLNAAAGRISFTLGLHGPALAVDTACSSSLVALHLAMRALRLREADAALAGGVNVIAAPNCSVAVSRAHMLSPDGRCKTFSAQADGFVRAEGVGIFVLKRLADARRDGDRVLAVLHGSAVNSDGASSGLTVPSGAAQEAVLAAALADAGVAGADVDYLEAHGTGTSLGDPIELDAAWSVYGRDRAPGEPLHLGSVKSNVGHCESASGVAALAKTVLALQHELIPGDLHADTLNPHVPWRQMNARVVGSPTPWRRGTRARLAGVSGFGFSGTNAHVIVGEAPVMEAPVGTPEGPVIVPVSAPDAEGVRRLAAAWADHVDAVGSASAGETEQAVPAWLRAAATTAATGRAHLACRRAVVASKPADVAEALRELATGAAPIAPTGRRRPRVGFLFSGQGSQYFAMGRQLYDSEPVFRKVVDECDADLRDLLGGSLVELMFTGEDRDAINTTRVTQPALVTLELALAALWESWGVTAAASIGHSVGEVAAAIHAGVMDRTDGLTLIAHRAKLMQDCPEGGMLAIPASAERVAQLLAEHGVADAVDVAAVNGPDSVVVAGPREVLEPLGEALRAAEVNARSLVVSHAFHSRMMEPVLAPLVSAIARTRFRAPQLPLVSNVTGALARDDEYSCAYWADHVRGAVRFHDGMSALSELGVDVLLEIGPDRTLINLATGAGLLPEGGAVPSLRRGGNPRSIMLQTAQHLYEQGAALDWASVVAAGSLRAADSVGEVPVRGEAPRYPFADTSFWTRVAPRPAERAVESAPAGPRATRHWGGELRSPALSGRAFSARRACDFPAYLTDHRLYGVVVTPAASHLGTTLSALAGQGAPVAVEDLICPRALVISDGEEYELQVLAGDAQPGPAGSQVRELRVQSLLDPEAGVWEQHIGGRLRLPAASGASAAHDVASWVDPRVAAPAAGPGFAAFREEFVASADRHVGGEEFYAFFRALGYTLGPSFRWIADVWIRGDEALVRYAQPQLPDPAADYEIYPGLIDSLFQSIAGFMVDDLAGEAPSLAIPFAATRLAFPGRPELAGGTVADLWGHVQVRSGEPLANGRFRVETADLHMLTADGASVILGEDFRVRHAPKSVLERSLRDTAPLLFTVAHEPVDAAPAGARTGAVTVLGQGVTADVVAAAFAAVGGLATGPTAPTAVVDARLLAPRGDGAADTPADSALEADAVRDHVTALAATLRAAEARVPHVVLGCGSAACAPLTRAAWGMLTALEAEQPDRRLVRVELDGVEPGDPSLASALLGHLAAGAPQTRLVAVAGPDGVQLRAARLVAAQAPAPGEAPAWGGSVLVTGGTGALGLSVAQAVAAQGATGVVLTARSAPDAAATAVIEALRAAGTPVSVVRGDVTDAAHLAQAVAAATATGPLRGVFHLAGVNADGAFDGLDDAAYARTFAGKAGGADALAAAVAGHDLTAFVLFSSISAALGSAGQVNYAAANGYLDGLARRLRADGVPAVAVNWGPWVPEAKGGMAANEAVAKAAAKLGVRALTDGEAQLILAAAAARAAGFAGSAGGSATEGGAGGELIAVALDVATYAAALAGHPRHAFVADLAASAAGSPRTAPDSTGGPAAATPASREKGWLRAHLESLPAGGSATDDEREDELRDAVRAIVGSALGDADAVDDVTGFTDLGLDSIMLIDLRTRLAHALDADLPATVALDHPSVERMTAYLAEHAVPAVPAAAAPAAPVAPVAPVAVPAPPLVVPRTPVAAVGQGVGHRDAPALDSLSLDELLSEVGADRADGL
ncbi:MAG: SDR family NAD(P)-dependent oxidoreductase [Kineosporiaceae bacterium]